MLPLTEKLLPLTRISIILISFGFPFGFIGSTGTNAPCKTRDRNSSDWKVKAINHHKIVKMHQGNRVRMLEHVTEKREPVFG